MTRYLKLSTNGGVSKCVPFKTKVIDPNPSDPVECKQISLVKRTTTKAYKDISVSYTISSGQKTIDLSDIEVKNVDQTNCPIKSSFKVHKKGHDFKGS